MKNSSLDTFYAELSKHILIVQSFMEIKNFSFLIRACRLKPYSCIFKKQEPRLLLYRWWFDEFGNSLKIDNYKKVTIVQNDLALDRDKIACTDLYFGLSLANVAKISKLLHVCSGKESNYLHQDYVFLSFLGIDNYLRTYLHLGEWQQVSPLLLGLENLRFLANNKEINHILHMEDETHTPIPSTRSHQWLAASSQSKMLMDLIRKQHETASKLLEGIF